VGLCSAKHVFVPGDLDLWSPKGEKTCPDSRPTRMENFMPLFFVPWKIRNHTKKKQVRQQACKVHTPPYSLKQCCCPQFPMPTNPRCRGWQVSYVKLAGSRLMATGGHYICQFQLPDPEVMPRLWIPASQCSPKGEKTYLDSRPTHMQNFMTLAFSAAEKSITVQKNTKKNKNTVN